MVDTKEHLEPLLYTGDKDPFAIDVIDLLDEAIKEDPDAFLEAAARLGGLSTSGMLASQAEELPTQILEISLAGDYLHAVEFDEVIGTTIGTSPAVRAAKHELITHHVHMAAKARNPHMVYDDERSIELRNRLSLTKLYEYIQCVKDWQALPAAVPQQRRHRRQRSA